MLLKHYAHLFGIGVHMVTAFSNRANPKRNYNDNNCKICSYGMLNLHEKLLIFLRVVFVARKLISRANGVYSEKRVLCSHKWILSASLEQWNTDTLQKGLISKMIIRSFYINTCTSVYFLLYIHVGFPKYVGPSFHKIRWQDKVIHKYAVLSQWTQQHRTKTNEN